jgi:hypothetical protein
MIFIIKDDSLIRRNGSHRPSPYISCHAPYIFPFVLDVDDDDDAAGNAPVSSIACGHHFSAIDESPGPQIIPIAQEDDDNDAAGSSFVPIGRVLDAWPGPA